MTLARWVAVAFWGVLLGQVAQWWARLWASAGERVLRIVAADCTMFISSVLSLPDANAERPTDRCLPGHWYARNRQFSVGRSTYKRLVGL